MAKDFLNLIERALMMGISDKINSQTASGDDIYVYGQYPDSEELQFPAVVVQQVASGFQEKFYGENITFGDQSNSGTTSGSGEVYGVAFLVHLFVDADTEITVVCDRNKDGVEETYPNYKIKP